MNSSSSTTTILSFGMVFPCMAEGKLEAATGVEPVENGFANRRLNRLATPPRGRIFEITGIIANCKRKAGARRGRTTPSGFARHPSEEGNYRNRLSLDPGKLHAGVTICKSVVIRARRVQ